MRYGFTGTQTGTTLRQRLALGAIFKILGEDGRLTEFHHGDCIGADCEAHYLLRGIAESSPPLSFAFPFEATRHAEIIARWKDIAIEDRLPLVGVNPGVRIVVHPPLEEAKRAFCIGDEERSTYRYIQRNENIVEETEALIACPKSMEEYRRSGTWQTVRRGRKQGRSVLVIRPDGTLFTDNPKIGAPYWPDQFRVGITLPLGREALQAPNPLPL